MFDNEKKEKYEEAAEKASKNYFREGLNCSECVLKSYLDLGVADFSMDIVALASGFGGGIGMAQKTCGALTGAVLSVGTIKGRKNPLDKATLGERIAELNGEDGLYKTFYSLVEDFEAKYGTVSCKELTEPFNSFHSRERAKHCQGIIGYAARLAVRHSI